MSMPLKLFCSIAIFLLDVYAAADVQSDGMTALQTSLSQEMSERKMEEQVAKESSVGANIVLGRRLVESLGPRTSLFLPATCTVGNVCKVPQALVREIVHPCQNYVAYGWVMYKYYKDLTVEGEQLPPGTPISKEAMQKNLDKEDPVPIILGPKGVPYAIDSHHTMASWDYWANITGHGDKVDVQLNILCNKANMSMAEFQAYLVKTHNAYLLLQNGPDDLLPPNGKEASLVDLPNSVTFPVNTTPSLANSVFRSLGGFARKVPRQPKGDDSVCPYESEDNAYHDRYCLRSFIRICDPDTGGAIPFYEFMWGYFMNVMLYEKPKKWPDYKCSTPLPRPSLRQTDEKNCTSDRQQRFRYLMKGSFDEALVKQTQSAYHYDTWVAASMLLNPLCRDKPAIDFVMPSNVASVFGRTKLPGIASHPYELFPEDPSCQFMTEAACE